MLTEEQIYLNISEVEIRNRTYKFYKYNLDGNETFSRSDMSLYGIDGLSVNGKGERLDLDGLEEFSHVRALSLSDKWYTSIDTLQTFTEIEHFRGPNLCDAIIPFDRFRKLYSAEVNYDHKTCQLLFDNSSIEFLRLHNYKQRLPNGLVKLKKLKHLALEQCKIEDLDFLEQLPRLKSFRISHNRNLKSIQGIVKNKNLKGIEIQGCKKVEDWDVLSRAHQLEYILLEDCGEIASLSFLEKFPSLKVLRFIGNTKVKDGQLKSILEKENLEYIKVPLCKHYDITLDDLRKFSFGYISLAEAISLYQSGNIEADPEEEIPVQNSTPIEEKDLNANAFNVKEFRDEVISIKEDMEEYLNLDLEEDLPPVSYTMKDIQSFENIMNEFLKELERNQKVGEGILCITKEIILKLNQLNAFCNGELIETEQREKIVSLILNAIEATGINVDHDITLAWREW